MFSKYEIKARIFPAFITMLPLVILSHFYLYQKIPKLIDSIFATKIFGDISIIFVFIYLVMQISRFISKKFLQDNIFQNEFHFPTTNYLLYSDNEYTTQKKEKIRAKIKFDFDLDLLDINNENKNETEARKKIKEAVDLIRNRVKNGRLLLQHNIEYGFVRNLVGGTVISLPFSIFNLIFFVWQQNNVAIILSVLLLLFYLIVLFFKKNILVYYANNYANILFNEYLS